MKEEWKQVKEYEGLYEVSNLGNVRSLPRNTTKGKVLKLYVSKKNGYCYAPLSKNNKKNSKRVHVLVMSAFRPVEKHYGYDKNYTINHIDGNKENNAINNLEWCSQSENQKHAVSTGLQKVTGEKVICLDTGIIYETYACAARSCGGKKGEMVARVCSGKRSHYRGKHFARLDDYLNNSIPEFKGKNKRKVSDTLWR